MQTFTHALLDLVLAGKIEREVAANAASNRHDFLIALDRALKEQALAAPPEVHAETWDEPAARFEPESVPEPEPEPQETQDEVVEELPQYAETDTLPKLRVAGRGKP
jgi:hypothetical protein